MKALFAEKPEIPKKPKSASGASEPKTKAIESNGFGPDPPSSTKLKRPLDDETEPSGADSKKRRVGDAEPKEEGALVVDDDGDNGAILIDDD